MRWILTRRSAALLCLLSWGCSSLRELPRDQYATRPERQDLRVETHAGTAYEFERARVSADSLYGLRRLDVEGRFEQFETTPLALDEVRRISVRRVDWYRTGLLLGVAAAAGIAAIVTQSGDDGAAPPDGPCGPRPCP